MVVEITKDCKALQRVAKEGRRAWEKRQGDERHDHGTWD